MEKLLRNVAIGACVLTIFQNAAKAQDFEVTTVPNYMGGYTSTYRSLEPAQPGRGIVHDLDRERVVILPNACDLTGRPAFEVVNRSAGEARCVGGR